jgi:hypothetical protein
MALSKFAGNFNATAYAYGITGFPGPLQVDIGTTVTGAGTLTLSLGYVTLMDGTVINPLNVNAPIQVGTGAGATIETVTPTAVSAATPTVYDTTTVTATFTYTHGKGEQISSGTFGLQEAINACSAYGGGTVIVDASWTALGGTQTILAAATIPAGVTINDNRSGDAGAVQQAITSLTKAQTILLNTVPIAVTPVPGAAQYIDVIDWTLVNKNGGTAYTSGGVITLGYGSANTSGAPTYSASAATVAATFLTSPTVTQVIKTAGALVTQPLSDIAGVAIFIMNATADFANAGATPVLEVIVNYRVVNT